MKMGAMSLSNMLISVLWVVVALLVGYSYQQGPPPDILGNYPQASPLVSQHQSRNPSQQVILPGGFQNQFYPNQFSNLGNPHSPQSIQNQQFAFLQGDPFAALNARSPASLTSARPSSRSLSPDFAELIRNANAARLTANQFPTARTPPFGPSNFRAPSDVQYEYYDETDGDLLYPYENNFNKPANLAPPSTAVNRKPNQYFTEVSPPRSKSPLRNSPTAAPQVLSTTPKPSKQFTSRTPILSGTSGRLFRNRPAPSPSAPSSGSREPDSSFIPLVDESEEPEPALALGGRSVQSSSRGNVLQRQTLQTLTRTTAKPSSSTSSRPTRTRTVTRTKPAGERNSSLPSPSRRPLRSNGTSRIAPRTPIIIRPRNLTRSRNRKEEAVASSTYRPDPSLSAGSSENPSSSLPVEDYTVEYVEYPFSNENNSSTVEYYEVSEETAQALLQRAKAKGAKTTNSSSHSNMKVTVSVSSKSSSTASSSSTTPSPERSEETPSEEVVVSVATTRTVGKKSPSHSIATSTPRVTVSQATGSSFVVASVQTSRSVGKKQSNQDKNKPLDSMTSGAETLPEYYEEEYTYPDNYPLKNEQSAGQNYGFSHEVIQPPSIAPTAQVDPNLSLSSVSVSHGYSESFEKAFPSEKQEEEKALQPRKLPSKKEEIPPGHFETLLDPELDEDVPLKSVNQEDLSEPEAVKPIPTTTVKPVLSTTEKPKKDPASLFSNIKFAEISPDFLPPGFKLPSPTSPPTTSTTTSTTTTQAPVEKKPTGIQFQEIDISSLLPKGYKPRPSLPKTLPFLTLSSTTAKPVEVLSAKPIDPLEAIKSIVKFQEIALPGLVPKDYTPPPIEEVKKENTSVLEGIKFEIPANLLPPGYKPEAEKPAPIKFETPTNLLPPGYKPPADADPIKFEFPANLLPPGYKPPSSASHPASTEAPIPTSSTSKKPSFGPVFPTKAGGARITRPTTTEPPKGDTPPPPGVRIATGWPTRKTTLFTGWPTIPTTPMPSTSSTTTTTTPPPSTTTTPTTTTTTPPPKRSPLGSCPQGICRLEASIRLVGGVRWVPEFQDINTDEYKNLETTVKRELDGAYRSSGLAPWYRKVEIEGFNRGSVIVDYFVLLDGIDRDLSTDFVVRQFHKSLFDSADALPFYDDSDQPDELVSNGRLRFGRYTIDPRYTDFKVVNFTKDPGPLAEEPLIPQWGIAVIVIGLASLLFIIIFGVTVLVNRHRNSKKKNAVSLTQEMLSEFNKSHMASGSHGMDNYGADDLYNMDDVWNDRQMDKTFDRKPTKRSHGSGKGSANYNIYDSWRTEWNGHYYNGAYYGDSGYAPSRRRSDYDTNF